MNSPTIIVNWIVNIWCQFSSLEKIQVGHILLQRPDHDNILKLRSSSHLLTGNISLQYSIADVHTNSIVRKTELSNNFEFQIKTEIFLTRKQLRIHRRVKLERFRCPVFRHCTCLKLYKKPTQTTNRCVQHRFQWPLLLTGRTKRSRLPCIRAWVGPLRDVTSRVSLF